MCTPDVASDDARWHRRLSRFAKGNMPFNYGKGRISAYQLVSRSAVALIL